MRPDIARFNYVYHYYYYRYYYHYYSVLPRIFAHADIVDASTYVIVCTSGGRLPNGIQLSSAKNLKPAPSDGPFFFPALRNQRFSRSSQM